MVEPIPILNNKNSLFVFSSTDFTSLISCDGFKKTYFWIDKEAMRIDSYIEGDIFKFKNHYLDLNRWLERGRWIFAKFLDEDWSYLTFLKRALRKMEGRTVLLSFSGGKDSIASLIVLDKLKDIMRFELKVFYVYMPFLEPLYNLKFVDKVSNKMGIKIEILTPPKKMVKKRLLKDGLPYRRARWCTYLKSRPLRDLLRRKIVDLMAVGDRIWEAGKRFRRLAFKVLKDRLSEGKKVYPVAPLTIVDIISLVRKTGLIHPDYLNGAIRVSCYYCPYKPIYELYLLKPDVEDLGLIEEVMRREYKKWYSRYCNFEEFRRYALWRFTPSVAASFLRGKRFIEDKEEEIIDLKHIEEMNSYPWLNEVKAPILSLNSMKLLLKSLIG